MLSFAKGDFTPAAYPEVNCCVVVKKHCKYNLSQTGLEPQPQEVEPLALYALTYLYDARARHFGALFTSVFFGKYFACKVQIALIVGQENTQ